MVTLTMVWILVIHGDTSTDTKCTHMDLCVWTGNKYKLEVKTRNSQTTLRDVHKYIYIFVVTRQSFSSGMFDFEVQVRD